MAHSADRHVFVEDGRRGCGPDCLLVHESCRCGLQRRLRILNGTVRTIDVKIPGSSQWIDVVNLLTVEVPYALCPRCGGEGCDTCRRLGVLERVPATAGSSR